MSPESQPPWGEPKDSSPTPETRWSVVLKAVSGDRTHEAKQALGQLCETYWQTLYRIARKQGRSDDQARELVQTFICRLLEGRQTIRLADPSRGPFRSFLWTCFNRFLLDEYKASSRQKAGGKMARHSLDLLGQDGSRILEPIENLTPEDAFRKSLALDTFQAAFDRLKAIWEARGEREKFGHLQAYLAEECRGSKARNLADKLEVSESRARCLVSELRRQFGGILREQVAQLLSDPTPADIDAELDWLWEALSL